MTEQEAKTKTCHRTLAPVASADGSAPWHSPGPCIGSECMAWRERETDESRRLAEAEFRKTGVRLTPIMDGHCGLAGKP